MLEALDPQDSGNPQKITTFWRDILVSHRNTVSRMCTWNGVAMIINIVSGAAVISDT